MFDEFTRSFYQSDILVVLPIYSAGEAVIDQVNSRSMCEEIRAHGHKEVIYFESLPEAESQLTETLQPGDLLLTLGAGDVWKVGETVLKNLESK